MKGKTTLALAAAAIALAACGYDFERDPDRQPPPLEFRFSGKVIEKKGRCHTIRSFRRGRRYSVVAGTFRGIPVGAAVRIEGRLGRRLGCPHPRLQIDDVQRI